MTVVVTVILPDLARVASFSTDTRFGRVGNGGTSLSMLMATLLDSLLKRAMGSEREVSGKLVPGVESGSTSRLRSLPSKSRI